MKWFVRFVAEYPWCIVVLIVVPGMAFVAAVRSREQAASGLMRWRW